MSTDAARTPAPSPDGPAIASEDVARRVADSANVPGLSFAVASPRRLLHAGAVGHADMAAGRRCTVEDQFPWFSMTKIATATAAMRLHNEGIVDLDASIATYIPDLPFGERSAPTLRQLLMHTAGLANPLPVRWVRPTVAKEDPSIVDRLLKRYAVPKREVGVRGAYSNIGYLLAGRVMETVTGTPIESLLRQLVLDPLFMDRTAFTFDPTRPRAIGYLRLPRVGRPVLKAALPAGIVGGHVNGHTAFNPFLVLGSAYGGLIGNVTDAVRLAAAHIVGPSDPQPVVPQHLLHQMQRITAPGKPFDHGIGWFRRAEDAHRSPAFVEHYGSGGGHWNAMRIYPQLGLAMVAMTNTSTRWDFDTLFTELSAIAST
jgi:CubicO group peptidase (beta-lactamase class C family)